MQSSEVVADDVSACSSGNFFWGVVDFGLDAYLLRSMKDSVGFREQGRRI